LRKRLTPVVIPLNAYLLPHAHTWPYRQRFLHNAKWSIFVSKHWILHAPQQFGQSWEIASLVVALANRLQLALHI
jgi:hypothetical protein